MIVDSLMVYYSLFEMAFIQSMVAHTISEKINIPIQLSKKKLINIGRLSVV